MKIEESFAKAIGRPATDAERERLHRLRDALGLGDNDALWTVVMALEHYDRLYREYPARLGEETAKAIEGARAAFAAAAAVEAARAGAALAEQVAHTSAKLARRLAERPVAVPWVAAAGAAWVLFGAVCMAAGAHLGSGPRPFWIAPAPARAGGADLLRGVLGAPAGWMAFLLLLPGAAAGARTGWRIAHRDEDVVRERVLGWSLVAGCALGALACLVLLAEVL